MLINEGCQRFWQWGESPGNLNKTKQTCLSSRSPANPSQLFWILLGRVQSEHSVYFKPYGTDLKFNQLGHHDHHTIITLLCPFWHPLSRRGPRGSLSGLGSELWGLGEVYLFPKLVQHNPSISHLKNMMRRKKGKESERGKREGWSILNKRWHHNVLESRHQRSIGSFITKWRINKQFKTNKTTTSFIFSLGIQLYPGVPYK